MALPHGLKRPPAPPAPWAEETLNPIHRETYRNARQTKTPEAIQREGLLGLSDKTLADLECDLRVNSPHAFCKWCQAETDIPKAHAGTRWVACSPACKLELDQHYN